MEKRPKQGLHKRDYPNGQSKWNSAQLINHQRNVTKMQYHQNGEN